MKKFKAKIIQAIENRKPFETKLVRVILGVNPNSVLIEIGGYFLVMIKEDEISISEDISASPNWTLNKKVIDRLNTVLSIYDLPQFTHKYSRWYLGDKEWVGIRRFKNEKD